MKKVNALAALVVTAGLTASAIAGDIRREGAGDRREALDKMELKAFDNGLISGLTGWSTDTPMTAANTQGKVVLVVSWASWHRISHTGLREAEKLADRYGKNGLVVLGVHNARGFDGASKVADRLGISFAYAHDANGKFGEALKIDQDPDFYLIDRAGNLRYADIATSSVSDAVTALVTETAEQARQAPILAAKAAEAAEAERWAASGIEGGLRPGQVLNVAFDMPTPDAFDGIDGWPKHNRSGLGGAQNFQGKSLPGSFGNETYLTKEPVTTGRVVVIDFWATWCRPCVAAIPMLEKLQKEHRQDLVILGISDEPTAKVRSFISRKKAGYTYAVDQNRTLFNAFGVQGIPHVVVLSTDGKVRWQGNPHQTDRKDRSRNLFIEAVEAVIDSDPGVQARRKAEAEFLAEQGKG